MVDSIFAALPRLSPLDLMEGAATGSVGQVAGLSPRDRIDLDRLLAKRVDFMPSPIFLEPDAQVRLFDEALHVPRPDVGWYQPSMPQEEKRAHRKASQQVRLTAAQERSLFLRFNYCRFRVAKLQREILGSDVLSGTMAREMLGWHRRAEDFRSWITGLNVSLVPAMARRCGIDEGDMPEYVSEGHLVLLASVDKFDAERGFKFSSYACRAILKAYGRQAKKLAKEHARFPAVYNPAADRSNFQELRRAEQVGDAADELKRIVLENRAELSEIERTIIVRRYPMMQPGEESAPVGPARTGAGAASRRGPTLAQVGAAVGLTKERVRQLEARAMRKIRKTLDAQWLA